MGFLKATFMYEFSFHSMSKHEKIISKNTAHDIGYLQNTCAVIQSGTLYSLFFSRDLLKSYFSFEDRLP